MAGRVHPRAAAPRAAGAGAAGTAPAERPADEERHMRPARARSPPARPGTPRRRRGARAARAPTWGCPSDPPSPHASVLTRKRLSAQKLPSSRRARIQYRAVGQSAGRNWRTAKAFAHPRARWRAPGRTGQAHAGTLCGAACRRGRKPTGPRDQHTKATPLACQAARVALGNTSAACRMRSAAGWHGVPSAHVVYATGGRLGRGLPQRILLAMCSRAG